MCTVSWFHERGGYQLFCNRDEKLSRKQALEPRRLTREGVRFTAPIDGEAGGSWIALNEFGLCLCLLNGSVELRCRREVKRSRGLLVLDLIPSESLREFRARIREQDLGCFAPFALAALQPGEYATVARWDGERLQVWPYGEQWMPLASSSFDPRGVQETRRSQMRQLLERTGRADAGAFLAFHRSHAPQPGPYSSCMHRPGARTVSFTWVTVSQSGMNLDYWPGPPCRLSSEPNRRHMEATPRRAWNECLPCC